MTGAVDDVFNVTGEIGNRADSKYVMLASACLLEACGTHQLCDDVVAVRNRLFVHVMRDCAVANYAYSHAGPRFRRIIIAVTDPIRTGNDHSQ